MSVQFRVIILKLILALEKGSKMLRNIMYLIHYLISNHTSY